MRRTRARRARRELLLITPALVGGSWRILERLATELGRSTVVVGMGPYASKRSNFARYTIPWFDYEEFGPKISDHLWGLAVYGLPLVPLAVAAGLLERPQLTIANGFYAGFIALVLKRWLGIPCLVSLQQKLPSGSRLAGHLVRYVGREGNGVFVNSTGNWSLVSRMVPESRVTVLPLWADDVYFRDLDRKSLRDKWQVAGRFVVLYVGRLDEEKNIDRLLEVSEILAEDERFLFVFVGKGKLSRALAERAQAQRTVRYLGRVGDLATLAELYQAADLVWSHADATYLSLPAIEALASGTPILVSSRPAIAEPSGAAQTVDRALVPPEVGWLEDITNVRKVASLLARLGNEGITERMRESCRLLALQRYSAHNVEAIRVQLEELFDQRARPGEAVGTGGDVR